MNDAQRNIITRLMSYGNFAWSQGGDYGKSLDIRGYWTVEDNYESITDVMKHVTCVVFEPYSGNDYFPNEMVSFSFECRFPTDHYHHYGKRCWYKEDDNGEREEIPYGVGEVEELGLEFAKAFDLPIRYIDSREEL